MREPEKTVMVLDPNATYSAPDDWRAYSGVLARRVFAFLIDYAIVLLLCIPAAVLVFIFGIITLGLGFFLYPALFRSEEHTSELQSLMRISYAVFCLTKKN